MAAPEGNTNANSNSGGKSLQDRKLASKVRTLTLQKCEKALNNEEGDPKLYQAVLLKLAGTVLPRLNEVSGPDGEKLIPIFNGQSLSEYKSNEENIQPKEANTSSVGGNVSQ